MSIFNPLDWYWIVGGDQTQVYSSARGIFVPVADPTYVAWLAIPGTPPNVATKIDTAANLGQVLAAALARPTDAGVLDGYTTTQATTIVGHVGFKIAFNHENRIRACERALALNGSPANLTAGQAIAIVKALM